MKRTLIIFAKAPRMGAVKTRLARDIGAAEALGFYRRSLDRTIRLGRALTSVETVIWTAPDNAAGGRYFPSGIAVYPQGRGDLGLRMSRALSHHMMCDRLLIGGDIPGITPEILNEAFDQLSCNDATFGPAEDGGFWLAGLRAGFQPRGLFCGVGWSEPTTLTQTLSTLPAHASIAFCQTLNDIDDLRDYQRLLSL
ncbi:TIGR04282 family arsenosugar biosynthesis glycosyltransferase [Minwuia sp.]|uniref:TIGR04282 family arsenosugar biosynthesis glycosyltransferase n=1 Tax=Minwuia sp. TaxID=2493630 RepID=UPI003A909DC7